MTEKKHVVDARADADGDIKQVRFAGNQRFTSVEKVKEMADRGLVDNAHTVHLSNGKSYLRSNPDGARKNNLDYLAGDS